MVRQRVRSRIGQWMVVVLLSLSNAGAASPQLDVTGLSLLFGAAGQDVSPTGALGRKSPVPGTAVLYRNVVTVDNQVVDAVVTFVNGRDLVTEIAEIRIDRALDDSDSNAFLQHALVGDGVDELVKNEASAELRIDFFQGGTYTEPNTGTPVMLSGVVFNVYDIDNAQAFEVLNLAAYQLSNNSHVIPSVDGATHRFASPDIDTSSGDGTSYTVGRAKVFMPPTVTMTYRVIVNGSGSQVIDFSNGVPWLDNIGGSEIAPVVMSPVVPLAPMNLVATLTGAGVSMAFTAPFDGGASITDYQYRLTEGGSWVSAGAVIPVLISLSSESLQRIHLHAVNSVGAGWPVAIGVNGGSNPIPAGNVGFRFGDTGQIVTPQSGLGTSYSAPGTALHYRAVATISGVPIDAVVTFEAGENLGGEDSVRDGKMRRIDYAPESSRSNAYLQHSVRTKPVSPGWVQLSIVFYLDGTYSLPGTGTRVTLSGLELHAYELDEGESFEIAGILGYAFEENTRVTANALGNGVYRFQSEDYDTSTTSGTAYTEGRVSVRLPPTDSLTYRVYFPAMGADEDQALLIDLSTGLAWTDKREFSLSTIPSAPTALVATPRVAAASIAFTPPTSDGGAAISNYQYSVDGGDWVAFSPAVTASPVSIGSLPMGGSYSIRLRAVNAEGAGAASEPVVVNLTAVPSAPVLTRLLPGDGSVTVRFTPPASDGGVAIRNYQYSLDGGDWVAFDPAMTTSPMLVRGLENGVPVSLRLRAVNTVGVGPASNSLSATPRLALNSVRALPSDTSVTLLFDSYPGALGLEYQLLRAPAATEVQAPWRATGTNTLEGALHLFNLTNDTAVCAQLRAVLAGGERGPASAPVCFTPTANPVRPEAEPQVVVPEEVQRVKREADGSVLVGFRYQVTNTSGVELPHVWVRTLDLPLGASVVAVVAEVGPGELRVFPWFEEHWYWEDVNLMAGETRSLSVTVRVRGDR